MKTLQTVLETVECGHRVTWKEGGIVGPQTERLMSEMKQG